MLGACALPFACAALPEARPERGLYVDLRKAVELRENDDWVVDRLEIEAAAPSVVRGVCQVSPDARERLLLWLDERIAAEGGPSEAAFAREGSLRAIRELLRLERVRALLVHTDDIARTECPFWLEVDPSFAGVQHDEGRFVVLAESMGGARAVISGGDAELGGGGHGRILPAYGFGPRVTLGVGLEMGAVGVLPEVDGGGRSFAGVFSLGVPAIVRFHRGARVVDLVASVTTRVFDGELLTPPGARFELGYGITTLRVGRVMPYALVWIGYEHQPSHDRLATEHSIWLGTRVGLDWDP